MHRRVRRTATILILLMLAALFTVPRAYLDGVCKEILSASMEARVIAQSGDDPGGTLQNMQAVFEQSAPKLRLFLDHGAVDALGAAIVMSVPLTEPEALLSALNEVEAAAGHLKNIESLSPDSIF